MFTKQVQKLTTTDITHTTFHGIGRKKRQYDKIGKGRFALSPFTTVYMIFFQDNKYVYSIRNWRVQIIHIKQNPVNCKEWQVIIFSLLYHAFNWLTQKKTCCKVSSSSWQKKPRINIFCWEMQIILRWVSLTFEWEKLVVTPGKSCFYVELIPIKPVFF